MRRQSIRVDGCKSVPFFFYQLQQFNNLRFGISGIKSLKISKIQAENSFSRYFQLVQAIHIFSSVVILNTSDIKQLRFLMRIKRYDIAICCEIMLL